jgi:Fic family protein
MTALQAAEKWGISDRRVRVLCAEGKIPGAVKQGKSYTIPADAPRPTDGRKRRGKTVPAEYRAMFARIDAKKSLLASRRPLTPAELERLREEFTIEFTYNSNAIEGNTLSLQETALVLQGVTIDRKPLKDHLEAVGHRDAFHYVQDLVSQGKALNDWEIRQIHSLVLIDRPEDRGVYRRIPVRIAGSAQELPQPYLVPKLMEQLLYTNSSNKKALHPVQRIAWFHLEFEGIHPFVDGNGRTGRLLINLDLMHNGYPPINIKFADRRRYYSAFDSYYRLNDMSPMVTMVAEYVEERLDRYLQILTSD